MVTVNGKWSCGVTTVPNRIGNLLPRTLLSLGDAGFEVSRLFVDGASDPTPWTRFSVPITVRSPQAGAAASWFLSLSELCLREPAADFYAVFQDDLIMCRNVRQHLEHCSYPEHGYWNLTLFPQYASALKGKTGWHVAPSQRGLSAMALVFSRITAVRLLSTDHFFVRAVDPKRGRRAVDGAVVTALNSVGFKEWVHVPSLTQHTGHVSAIGNSAQPQMDTFPGEDFDALSLPFDGQPPPPQVIPSEPTHPHRVVSPRGAVPAPRVARPLPLPTNRHGRIVFRKSTRPR